MTFHDNDIPKLGNLVSYLAIRMRDGYKYVHRNHSMNISISIKILCRFGDIRPSGEIPLVSERNVV